MENSPGLLRLGYDQFFDDNRIKLGANLGQIARVTTEHRGAYDVVCEAGEYRATVTGRRMLKASSRDEYPAVGDWVIINQDENETKLIIDILPRKTTLHKKYTSKDEAQLIATNVDVAFIVESIDRDHSLNRLERHVVLAREGGIEPVIVINKVDLSAEYDLDQIKEAIRDRFDGVDILETSTVSGSGLQMLASHIETGKTYCFIGSSGVGKSSIINKLLQEDRIATGAVGPKTGRGQHTTTARQMYSTLEGGIIIDNPGSREVGVADSETGVGEVFADIESIASTCKFRDCKHIDEPGCAVQVALKAGSVDRAKFENYQKLQRETEYYKLNPYDKRQKDKNFGKFLKNAKKDLKRFKSK